MDGVLVAVATQVLLVVDQLPVVQLPVLVLQVTDRVWVMAPVSPEAHASVLELAGLVDEEQVYVGVEATQVALLVDQLPVVQLPVLVLQVTDRVWVMAPVSPASHASVLVLVGFVAEGQDSEVVVVAVATQVLLVVVQLPVTQAPVAVLQVTERVFRIAPVWPDGHDRRVELSGCVAAEQAYTTGAAGIATPEFVTPPTLSDMVVRNGLSVTPSM